MSKRIRVYVVKCRRGCGRSLATASRSIWGIDEAVRKKYQGICESCMTYDERLELKEAQLRAVRKTITGQL